MKINKMKTCKLYLLELFDIARCAVNINDDKVYRLAAEKIYSIIFNDFVSSLNVEKVKSSGITFSDEQIDYMKQVLNMVCLKDRNFFSNDSSLIALWYPNMYLPLSDRSMNFIWWFVCNVIDADKKEWFLSYWTLADQYYRFILDSMDLAKDRDENFQYRKNTFKQFHIALGAYLFFKQKNDWLRDIMFFTQSMPPTYVLMNNTMDDIFQSMSYFDGIHEKPAMLSSMFLMSGMVNDVKTDSTIFSVINDYLALLMLRLSDMDYDVSYQNPYKCPDIAPDADVTDLKRHKLFVDILETNISKFENTELVDVMRFDTNSINEAKKALEAYKTSLDDRIYKIYKNPETDKEKIERIKNELISEANGQLAGFPLYSKLKRGKENNSKTYYFELPFPVSIEDFAKYMPRLSANLEQAIISSLLMRERKLYNSFFLLNKPCATYTISYCNIFKALKKLGVNDSHVILSLGVYLGNFSSIYGNVEGLEENVNRCLFSDAEIISVASSLSSIAVFLKSEMPYIEYKELDEKKDFSMKCIDKSTALYSNVDELGSKQPILRVGQNLELVQKGGVTNYIMLRVNYNIDSTKDELNTIEKYAVK